MIDICLSVSLNFFIDCEVIFFKKKKLCNVVAKISCNVIAKNPCSVVAQILCNIAVKKISLHKKSLKYDVKGKFHKL